MVAVFGFLLAYGVDPRWTWLGPRHRRDPVRDHGAVSVLLSSLYVRFRDVAIIWGVLATALFYGTPMLYPFEFVPEQYRDLLALNPLTPLFIEARKLIIDPSAPGAVEAAGGSAPVLAAGGSVARGVTDGGTSTGRLRGSPRSCEVARAGAALRRPPPRGRVSATRGLRALEGAAEPEAK